MFACSECVGANKPGPMLMKLTTICDVCHVISYTRPSSPLFFAGGTERKAWERGYGLYAFTFLKQLGRGRVNRDSGCTVSYCQWYLDNIALWINNRVE